MEFYERYYRFPMYKDSKWNVYKALGERKIGMGALVSGLWRASGRYKSKGISSNVKGEGWLEGGIMVFDKHGILRYVYEERFGDELKLDEIKNAIQSVRDDDHSSNGEFSSSS